MFCVVRCLDGVEGEWLAGLGVVCDDDCLQQSVHSPSMNPATCYPYFSCPYLKIFSKIISFFFLLFMYSLLV